MLLIVRSDNICQHALQTGKKPIDEHWDGTEQEELDCIVSEVS